LFFELAKMKPVNAEAVAPMRMSVADSIVDVDQPLRLLPRPSGKAEVNQLAGRIDSLLPQLISWSDRQNVYAEGALDNFAILCGEENIRPPSLRTLMDWDKTWGQSDTGSSRGRVRYEGGDPLSGSVSPEHFRLRPDSAGYRAGKDGCDLGADIDMVGPGAAYERWKKTPVYQEWLKNTGKVK
jgi:hypothetical protein